MPEIPQSTGPRVRTAPLPTPLANPGMARPDAFGASIAEGLQRGAMQVDDANQRYDAALRQAEEDQDDIEAMNAANGFIEEDHQRMTEFRAREGGNAKNLLADASTDYKKRQEEHGKKLTRPGAREKFRQITDARWANRNSAILGEHQANELEKYETQTLEAGIRNTHLDALDEGTDDALIRADRLTNLQRQEIADRKGLDPQTRDLLHRADREALFASAIEQNIEAGDWKAAKARLDKFGESALSEGKRTVLSAKIREGGLNQEAQDTADTIFKSGFATKKADADRMVAAIKDADLRQRTQTKVDQEWARREAHIADTRGATYENLSKAVDAGADVERLLLTDPNAVTLEQADKDRLRLTAARAAERKAPPALSSRFYELRNLAAVSPQTFARLDLRLERGVITEDERGRLMEMQADETAARRTANGKAKPVRGIMSIEDVGNTILRSIDINPNVVDGKIDPRALEFKTQFDRAIVAAGGADNLETEQIRDIAKRLVVEETRKEDRGFLNPMRLIRGDSYDVKVRAFEAPGADKRAFTLSQVPAEYVNEALKMKGKDGKPPSELQILNAYNASISSGK